MGERGTDAAEGPGQGPLAGLRVVDASAGVAGPVAAMLLGDLGADVVLVERAASADPGAAVWQRGKRRSSMAAVGMTAGQPALFDVVVSDGPLPDVALPERTVHLQVPPYLSGATWPLDHGSDALVSALLGVAMRQFSDEPGPVDSVVPVIPFVHGVWAAAAVVAALVERETSGLGQVVTVGGAQAGMVAFAGGLEIDLSAPAASRGGDGGGRVPFYRTYRCGDGRWLFLAALTPRFSELAFVALGLAEMVDDPRLDGRGRAAMLEADNIGWVTDSISGAFSSAGRDEWLDRLHDAGCPAGPVADRADWLDHPQLDAIGMRVELDDPVRGQVVMPGFPIALDLTPGVVRGPAPGPAAATPPGWNAEPWPLPSPRDDATTAVAGPLDGVTVLDLGAIIAGPYAGSLLAELGAAVVKVEPPAGDSFRGPGFAAYNKGQRSVSIDLRRPEGRDVLLSLARSADVVIDNYRPGVLGRLGLDRDDLVAVNPSIVSLSVTGFGDHGPLGTEAGFDPVLQAMSGMMAAQGGDGSPVFFSVPVNDVTTAATAALGAAAAVLHARRTGEGQKVTTSLAAVSALIQAEALVRYEGRPSARVGGRDHRGPSAIDRLYPVADGWVRVLPGDDPNDVAAARTVDDMSAWLAPLSRSDAVAALHAEGLRAVPVRQPAELVDDEVAVAAGVIRRDPRPGREGRWTAGSFVDMSRTPVRPTALAPRLGEHSTEVLREAGYDAETVASLIADGVVIVPAPRST